jgi:hypothetical protein
VNLIEIRALAAKIAADTATLNRELGDYQPPTPPAPAPTSRVVLEVAKGVTANAGVSTDLEKLRAMFPAAGAKWGAEQGMWADLSSRLQVFPDGRFRVILDRKNWANIPNAAIPLDRPVAAARLSYRVTFGPTGTAWAWGQSGKLPGLARHKAGFFPGGGRIGTTNFSNCPAWAIRGSEIGMGPYVYGQHQPNVAEQWWGPDYADGTLRWGAPIIPGISKGGTFLVEVEHRPAGQGRSKVTWRVNGTTRWEETMQLLAPDQPHEITHCHFRVMYGGDNLSYWPSDPPAVTVVEFADFKVEEM